MTAGSCPTCAHHQDRLLAVLAIHTPCHTAETPAWECPFGHSDDDCDTGIPGPNEPASCMTCGGDWQIAYPCPTAAAALGVEADGRAR
jgi:hypothetical protein